MGIGFRVPILRWSGWRWDLLPLLTLLTGSAAFGLLLARSWHLTSSLRGEGGIECEAFYYIPIWTVLIAMRGLVPELYPLALLTRTFCGAG